jgi:acetyl-CoA C-acetyltransferase
VSDVVIISAVRTPTGRLLGGLRDLSAPELGGIVTGEIVRRADIDPGVVEECIFGNVLTAGVGQAPARQAALRGGLSPAVSALTINMVCGSGLKAVMLAADAIAAQRVEVVVAGGMESMSNTPHLLRGREGIKMGNAQLADSMITDGLWCAFENWHMGNAAELVAAKYGISRESQDQYAAESHRRAAAAEDAGMFRDEIVPIDLPARKGARPITIAKDESIRRDTSIGVLAALKPAFTKDGTVTAGNAPSVNDAAAGLLVTSERFAARMNLKPIARIVGQATSGIEPKLILMTPVDAVRQLLARTGWRKEDVDLFEVNEAFSVQALAVIRELDLDPEKTNINGGAVALGHPIGASGARVLTTLLHALAQRQLRRGIATLCLGGGNGVALAIERA